MRQPALRSRAARKSPAVARVPIVQSAQARHDLLRMRRLTLLLGLSVFMIQVCPAFADDRGWSYLIEKLVADGVDRGHVNSVFQDRRVDAFDGLDFSPFPPREPRSRYRRFLRPASVAAARRCRAQNAQAFESAEREHGVSANVLAAILYVESGCGRNTGSSVIFHRLARLAMANEPSNVRRNLERWTDDGGYLDPATEAKIRARARYLENTFYPEVRALFEVADRLGVAPLDIRGSGSGAFGYPQFLPTSYLTYGVDGDGDGRVSLYDTHDAAASCASYFVGHGWRPGLSKAQRRAAVWQYNRSEAYVDTVLTLATRISQPGGRSSKKSVRRNNTRRRAGASRHHRPHPG